jgi:hypothetical protein
MQLTMQNQRINVFATNTAECAQSFNMYNRSYYIQRLLEQRMQMGAKLKVLYNQKYKLKQLS